LSPFFFFSQSKFTRNDRWINPTANKKEKNKLGETMTPKFSVLKNNFEAT